MGGGGIWATKESLSCPRRLPLLERRLVPPAPADDVKSLSLTRRRLERELLLPDLDRLLPPVRDSSRRCRLERLDEALFGVLEEELRFESERPLLLDLEGESRFDPAGDSLLDLEGDSLFDLEGDSLFDLEGDSLLDLEGDSRLDGVSGSSPSLGELGEPFNLLDEGRLDPLER